MSNQTSQSEARAMTTHQVQSDPAWLAQDLCEHIAAAKTVEEYMRWVKILGGYMTRLAEADAHTESVKRLVEAAGGILDTIDGHSIEPTGCYTPVNTTELSQSMESLRSALTAYQQSVGGSNA